ncbi:MAG TPA: hypothetical protein VK084_01940 [Chitinophagaceae bacterium]|nr:hypothetical protein [Chitinophagaceae bacterium]
MRTITVSEFRKHIKKYADMAGQEKVIVNRGQGKSFFIVPLEKVEDKGYSLEFVKKVLDTEESAEKSKKATAYNQNV